MASWRRVRNVIANRNVAFGTAIVLGLILGPIVKPLAVLTLPALGVLIALTAADVPGKDFSQPRLVLRATGLALVFTYVLNTVVVVALARLLVPEPDLYAGFALVAASPPAVGGLGFCAALRGDVLLSLVGTIGAHVAALVVTPLLVLLLIGSSLIQPRQLFVLLVELIAIPLAISRLLRVKPVLRYVRRWRGPIINWAYALVILVAIGVNRDVIFRQPLLVGRIALVAFVATFGLGTLTEYVLRRWHVTRGTRVSLVLFATLKNAGFAASAALALISARASLPGAISSVFISLYLLYLGLVSERLG
jgi:bile acid:Na+ symporter, BASS family